MDQRPEPCSECRGSGWKLVERDGVELVERCACAEAARRERLLERAGIPARYRHCTLDSFDERWVEKAREIGSGSRQLRNLLTKAKRRVQEFVDLYPETEKGLLLMGNVGTGKTHLAVAALQELIRDKGVSGRFVDFTALVLEIQMTFDGGGDRREIVRPLIQTEVLVLDELGARKPTPWVMDLLYYLVNERYLAERTTVFTTNYSDFARGNGAADGAGGDTGTAAVGAESLRDRVSARIRSRLYEMCRRVELRGADFRQHCLATADERRNP